MKPAPNHRAEREAWLNRVAEGLRPIFRKAGAPFPERFRVTLSLTPGRRVVGACYDPKASADGTAEILVRIDQAEAAEVAGILAHELVHAGVGLDCGHRGPFKRAARAIGLEGPLRATKPGAALLAALAPVLEDVGPFPHAALDFAAKRSGPKRQKNRHHKVSCWCGYSVRITQTWLDSHGPPICPKHKRHPMKEEADG